MLDYIYVYLYIREVNAEIGAKQNRLQILGSALKVRRVDNGQRYFMIVLRVIISR